MKTLSAAEIKATLTIGGQNLTDEQVAALAEFIERFGIERARKVVESLEKVKTAA
jgi:hypothetical protein